MVVVVVVVVVVVFVVGFTLAWLLKPGPQVVDASSGCTYTSVIPANAW